MRSSAARPTRLGVRSLVLLVIASVLHLAGCYGEDLRSALIRNDSTVPVAIEYVRDGENRYAALDSDLPPGMGLSIVRPFQIEGPPDGCLRGYLVAVAPDGREVARITGLCDGGEWRVSE